MPIVFGGAPVVNSLYSVTRNNLWGEISPFFWAGLILVIAGAAIVLVFAPRGDGGPESRVESREPEATRARSEKRVSRPLERRPASRRLAAIQSYERRKDSLCSTLELIPRTYLYVSALSLMSLRHQAPLKRICFTAV